MTVLSMSSFACAIGSGSLTILFTCLLIFHLDALDGDCAES